MSKRVAAFSFCFKVGDRYFCHSLRKCRFSSTRFSISLFVRLYLIGAGGSGGVETVAAATRVDTSEPFRLSMSVSVFGNPEASI